MSVGAGIVLYNPARTHILLICDSRSNKWSFPKGHRESYDRSLLCTAVREMHEETDFRPCDDYNVKWTPLGIFGDYTLFQANGLHTDLHCTSKLSEHVAAIQWVPVQDIWHLRLNYPTKAYLKTIHLY
jgi:8-oxo-dGTP pyrophosphatase MutT (NUDIX family)